MKMPLMLTIAAGAGISCMAFAASTMWDGSYRPFAGAYLIYSNDLDEKAAPTAKDRRVSFAVEGAVARQLFDSIGPDQKDACGSSPDLRVRYRGDLSCTFYKLDKRSPYTCHFGMDLRSGKSIAGSTC
jgi:hypothetical protein